MDKTQTAYFAGGCFWCTEAIFQQLKGVVTVTPGYSGGLSDQPNYEQVSTGTTGHTEAIKIEYDSEVISYNELLAVFFGTHDPTTINQQGHDIGEQYRSVILFTDQEQKKQAENFIKKLTNEKVFKQSIVTEIKPFDTFYLAEDYHQDYYNKNKGASYCVGVINPKLEKLRNEFKDLLK